MCLAGASLISYWMSGTSQSDVNPGGEVATSNLMAALVNGVLMGSFDVDVSALPLSGGSQRRRLQQAAPTVDLPLIFASGRLGSSGQPVEHNWKGSATVNLNNGTIVETTGLTKMEEAHAWIVTIGWGVLVPAGIVMARSFKDAGSQALKPPLWFHVHRAVMSLGFVLGCVGVGLGFAASSGGWDTPYAAHRNMGVAVSALGLAQVGASPWPWP